VALAYHETLKYQDKNLRIPGNIIIFAFDKPREETNNLTLYEERNK
jgi:hypothetical protein